MHTCGLRYMEGLWLRAWMNSSVEIRKAWVELGAERLALSLHQGPFLTSH